jgi:hypothetical protein
MAMKKSTIICFGLLLLGSIFVSQHLISRTLLIPDEDPVAADEAVSELKVFPNPSDGRFQLTFEYTGNIKISAKVYDITGKLVKDISEDLVTIERSVNAQVDLESPRSGIYFIRIEWGNSLLTKKIIIR